MKTTIKKMDEELQVVYGEVYPPNFPDSDGDFMTEKEVLKMAHSFLASGRVSKVDTQHDNEVNGSHVVESFIARKDDPEFIEGSWVVGVKIPDEDLWGRVKSGELNGFSFEGLVRSEKTTIELELPYEVAGSTDDQQGHSHKFTAKFNDEGELVGGYTSGDDDHYHEIRKGTVTEEAGDPPHTHRFSYIEEVTGNAQG